MAVKAEPQVEARVEQEKTLIEWTALSRPFRKSDSGSKQVVIVLGLLISMVLGFAGEWMLLLVIAAGAFYWYAASRVQPEEMEYKITNRGIRAYGRLFGWEEFYRWWWTEKWTTKMLALDLVTGVMGRVFIPVDKAKAADIEKIMNQNVLYEVAPESTLDRMGKWVGEKFPLESKI